MKFILRSPVKATAKCMMHEAMNGFSVVFTGTFLQSAELSKPVGWVRAGSLEDLLQIDQGQPNVFHKRVDIIC